MQIGRESGVHSVGLGKENEWYRRRRKGEKKKFIKKVFVSEIIPGIFLFENSNNLKDKLFFCSHIN